MKSIVPQHKTPANSAPLAVTPALKTKRTGLLKTLTLPLVVGGFLLAAQTGLAQTTVTMNPHQPWVGFMNVFGLNGDGTPNYGAYQFGSGWGLNDLRAHFDATGTNFATVRPCTNVWNPGNAYWVNLDGSPNKWMDASFYVENNNIAGQLVTFTGTCLSNTLTGNANSVAFIKDFVPNYSSNNSVTAPLVPGETFTLTLQTTAGHHVQWGFETQGPDVNPTDPTTYATVACDNTNVSLVGFPGLALIEGQTATFNVPAFGAPPLKYQWSFSSDGFNFTDLADGGKIRGSISNLLTITNVGLADIGYYLVTVTNELGLAQETATLGVQPLSAQIRTNMLADPGFEGNAFAASPNAGWTPFNGAGFQSTNDFYSASVTPVAVRDGTNCFHTYSNGAGSYNGVYQDRPATPGSIYTGNAWFFTPSADPITDVGVCYLEVQFLNAGKGLIRQYKSGLVSSTSPTDTWINLTPTNVYAADFTTFLGTSPHMVAPPESAYVRFQITQFAGATGGSVYQDSTNLRLRSSVASAALSGNSIQIGFPTIYGPIYDVLYKTNLTDATWKVLTTVTGDAAAKTVADPVRPTSRFYKVTTE